MQKRTLRQYRKKAHAFVHLTIYAFVHSLYSDSHTRNNIINTFSVAYVQHCPHEKAAGHAFAIVWGPDSSSVQLANTIYRQPMQRCRTRIPVQVSSFFPSS
uniref:Uncharacterized protein n=1 Tax=Octopus bimaculoides TaxID=37653 RepID=A0A0L8H6N9_OCTBM